MRKVLMLGLALSLMSAMSVHAVAADERVATSEQYPVVLDAGAVAVQSVQVANPMQERLRGLAPVVAVHVTFNDSKTLAPKEVAHGVGEGIRRTAS